MRICFGYSLLLWTSVSIVWVFVCQAEDGIRCLVRSRGLGDGYKRQDEVLLEEHLETVGQDVDQAEQPERADVGARRADACLLYTSDAADERSSVDLGGGRILKKKTKKKKKKRQMKNIESTQK